MVNVVGDPIISIWWYRPWIFTPVYTADLSLFPMNIMIYVILLTITYLSLSFFENAFIYWMISFVVERVSSEKLISRWSLIRMLWKYSTVYHFLNDRLASSDWTSLILPPRLGVCAWRSLHIIVHSDISLAWVFTTL